MEIFRDTATAEASDDYPGGNPPEIPTETDTGKPVDATPPETPDIETDAVPEAPVSTLPVTGGDVIGLAGIGLAAVISGAAVVRRTRARRSV